ncbi:MAG: polysaccharide pyruvyl transferase family protein [Pseudomonadota bacterium]
MHFQTGRQSFLGRFRNPSGPARAAPAIDATHPTTTLFAWSPKDGSRNFGDHLSHVIAEAVAAERGLTFHDEVSQPRRLLAIGSILHFAQDGDVIWGSGINGKIPLSRIAARSLDIRAVRGPLTRAHLQDKGFAVPEIFGDPALLARRYFGDRFPRLETRDYIVIPNLHDIALVADHPAFVSPLNGWNRCIEAICSARFVVASSLHGVIVAESFGVPARLVRLTDTESPFKYDDYAQGTGRDRLTPARSIDEALDMGPYPPAQFDAERLVDAFPWDLWT